MEGKKRRAKNIIVYNIPVKLRIELHITTLELKSYEIEYWKVRLPLM